MKTNIFLTICLLFFIAACNTEDMDYKEDISPTVAEGLIVDGGTGEPIPYAFVWLSLANDEGAGLGGNGLDYVQADEKGHFSFQFNAIDNYRYVIYAEAPYYFNEPKNNKVISGEHNSDMRVELQPKGFIRYRLVNEAPMDTIAQLDLPNVFDELRNLSKDTVIYAYEKGGLDKELEWWLQRTNEKEGHTYKANVYVPALDTVDMIIKY